MVEFSLIRLTSRARTYIFRNHPMNKLMISKGPEFSKDPKSPETDGFNLVETPGLTCECITDLGETVTGFKSLYAAHIDMLPASVGSQWRMHQTVPKAVVVCSNTSRLYLGWRAIDALCDTDWIPDMLPNLTWLGLGYVASEEGWTVLGRLVNRSPNLKELILEEGVRHVDVGIGGGMTGFEEFAMSAQSQVCLELSLEKIEFRVFNWTQDELDLLEYFLTKGKVLKRIIICGRPLDVSMEKKLRSFPNHERLSWK